jgi:translation initiation factor 1A
MPNFKGGKKYKAGKHTETKAEFYEVDWSAGQSVGRILKPLGDRNMLVFCHDNKERICHIRGAIKKSERITVGDLVLISIRAQEMNATQSTQKDKGDILVKYEREQHRQLKKIGVNPALFTTIEVLNPKQRAEGVNPQTNEDGIEFDYGSDEDDSSDEDGNSSEEEKKRDDKKRVEETKRAAARTNKVTSSGADDDTVDIDAI